VLDREGGVRGIHLDRVPRIQPAKVEREVAGRDLELHEVRLEARETQLGAGPGSHVRSGADLDLEIAGRTRVQFVARREGRVEPRLDPLLGPGTPEGHLAVDEAEPRRGAADGARFFTCRRVCDLGDGNPAGGEDDQQCERDGNSACGRHGLPR
jgi:hypothetical protein